MTSLDLRRQKLIEQSTNLLRRVDEVKVAAAEWKSNLTSLSVGQSGLSVDSSTELRTRVSTIAQEVKKLDDDMKAFVNQMYKLQDTAKNFERDVRTLQLSVQDASQVHFCQYFSVSFENAVDVRRKRKIYSAKWIAPSNKRNEQWRNRP